VSPASGTPGVGHPGNLVTIVIPARDEEAFIGACLESVLVEHALDLQVIVVDGASTDRTADIVRSYAELDPRVELLHNALGVIPVSLNMALAAARGRWVVRVDAHSTVPPGYIAGMVEHLSTGRWGGVGGRKDGVGVTAQGQAVAAAMASRFGVGNSPYHYARTARQVEHVPFGAYPTELARHLGGWDERLLANQDYEFDYRLAQAGHRILLDPTLVIRWHCRQSVTDLFRQYRRYGRDKANMAFLHPRSLRARQLLPSVLVLSWFGAGALVLRRPKQAGLLLAPYPAALLVASLATGRGLAPGVRRWVPAAFAAMHAGWGIGFLEIGSRLAFDVALGGRTRRAPARPGVVGAIALGRRRASARPPQLGPEGPHSGGSEAGLSTAVDGSEGAEEPEEAPEVDLGVLGQGDVEEVVHHEGRQ
jgi:succinoglycan biosynthesis protein ExoA